MASNLVVRERQPDVAMVVQQPRDQNETNPKMTKRNANLQSPWELAIKIFNESLTKDERKKFALDSCPHCPLEAFLQEVSAAQDEAQRKRSKILDRINTIVERVTLYSRPMDTLAQTNQELLFAWGTMKFLMQIVMSEKHTTDKLAQAIADVVQIFGRSEQYTVLFAGKRRVHEAIGILYADVLNLLVRSAKFYNKKGIKRFVSTTATPFEVKFAPIVADIEKHTTALEREVNLARTEEEKEESQLQRSFRENQQTRQTDQMRKEVTLWLQPADTASDLRKLREARTTGTCNWLLTKAEYSDWVDSKRSTILWIYGIPGSGKSVLASSIVDRLSSTDPSAMLVYFFCSSRNENRRVSTSILRSLVFQLGTQRPDVANIVEEVYKTSTSRTADNFEELWGLFERAIQAAKPVVCVIDGLDECQERDDEGSLEHSFLARQLVKLTQAQDANSYLKILLTSRNEPDLRSAFVPVSNIVQTISITASDVSKDIDSFIKNRLGSSEELAALPEETKDSILMALNEGSSGMFIWARLMIQELETRDSRRAIEEALKSLPRKLFDLYDRIIDSLAHNFKSNDGRRDLGCFILFWVLNTSRPLTLTELSEARCIVGGLCSLSVERKPLSLVSFRKLIEAACSALVEVRDDGLVQLTHHTTKEYLLSRSKRLVEICRPAETFSPLSLPTDPHDMLFHSCLSYLNLATFEAPLLGHQRRFTVKGIPDVRASHVLLDYATGNLFHHLLLCEKVPYKAVRQFFESAQAATWIEAVLVLQGGVQWLASTIEPVSTLIGLRAKVYGGGEDAEFVSRWLSRLQNVIFKWSGTLDETPSEIHHLELPEIFNGRLQSKRELQVTTTLSDPDDAAPDLRPIASCGKFILRGPYLYAIGGGMSFGSFLTRYHWSSMQALGDLSFPGNGGVREVQLSPSGRYISAVKLSTNSISTALWNVCDEGFEEVSWTTRGIVDEVVFEVGVRTLSAIPSFEGPTFSKSGRHCAFSADDKTLYTPVGAYDLVTGKKTAVPRCCIDTEIVSATWSEHGERIACIRSKSLEIYNIDNSPIATFHNGPIADSQIADFGKSARYLLLVAPEKWQYSIYDIHTQTFSVLPNPSFGADEDSPEFVNDRGEWSFTVLSHALSPCERYVYSLVDDLNKMYTCFLTIWDRASTQIVFQHAIRSKSDYRPTAVSFDPELSGVLHVLLQTGSHFDTRRGFIRIDVSDKSTHDILYRLGSPMTDCKGDICVGPRGGFAYVRTTPGQRRKKNGKAWMVHVLQWDLKYAPPKFGKRIIVPRVYEGWTDGYSASNGWYNNAVWLSKDSERFLVGGRLLANSSCLDEPKPIHVFDAELVWAHLVSKGKADLTRKDTMEDIKKDVYWCFLSPDESMICFYCHDIYVAVFSTQSFELMWFYQYTKHPKNYQQGRPIFHPWKPMLAWKEKWGENREYREGGVFIVDCDKLENEPVLLKDSNVGVRGNTIFSPDGMSLFVACMTKDNKNERFITISSFSMSTLSLASRLVIRNPVTAPPYCSDTGHQYSSLILQNGEVAFLVNFDYKVVLAKVDWDGTVKWKVVASRLGPPESAPATALSAWGKNGELEAEETKGRLDLVFADQGYDYPIVVNTWGVREGEWDEIRKMELLERIE